MVRRALSEKGTDMGYFKSLKPARAMKSEAAVAAQAVELKRQQKLKEQIAEFAATVEDKITFAVRQGQSSTSIWVTDYSGYRLIDIPTDVVMAVETELQQAGYTTQLRRSSHDMGSEALYIDWDKPTDNLVIAGGADDVQDTVRGKEQR